METIPKKQDDRSKHVNLSLTENMVLSLIRQGMGLKEIRQNIVCPDQVYKKCMTLREREL